MEISGIFLKYSGKQNSIFFCLTNEEVWAQRQKEDRTQLIFEIDR